MTPYHLVSKENEVEEKIDISPASETGQTSAEHAIDLDRIRQGLDVRSTVGFFFFLFSLSAGRPISHMSHYRS